MSRRRTLIALGVLTAIMLAILIRLRGPAPLLRNAPAKTFSAVRAAAVLGDILREQRPHPVATRANEVVRDRIAQRFRALGYDTFIQRKFVCNGQLTCAVIQNIVARSAGEGRVVFLAAHYDSVPAGPGASDDGTGVATLLEVARAVRGERHRNPIGFLVTDGEEAGLLGAEAFVSDDDLRRQTGVIVNVENRGSSGPSFLFETSAGNARLIRAVRAVERSYASSLFYTIYDLLPNDTDVTVFKRDGLQALNFAAIGDVGVYHTPLDDLAHVDLRTLQHHGDNALAAARALADADLAPSSSNAVYFDVLGLAIVAWPESLTIWLVLVSLAILLIGFRGPSWRGVSAGAAMFIGALGIAVAAAFVLAAIAHARAGEVRRLAYPLPAVASMWLAGAASAVVAASAVRRFARRDLYLGVALMWHLVALVLAVMLPGVSFLFLVPALATALAAALRANEDMAALLSAAVAAILFFPLATMIYTALGKLSLVPTAAIVTLIASLFVAGTWRVALAVFGGALIAAAVTNVFPLYSAFHPRRTPLTHELKEQTVDLWAARRGQLITIRVRSHRGADQVIVSFSRDAEVLEVNGTRPAPRNPRHRRRSRTVTVYGREATIVARVAGPVELRAWDLSYGVPTALLRTRRVGQVPSGRGDVTVSETRAEQ
jgi:hypothetical protein